MPSWPEFYSQVPSMTASQDLSETEEDFSLYKTQFKFETNPSADFTLKMYAIFVPEDDPTYQIWWMGDGVSLTLWTYDDAHPDSYARVVQNGEILTYADLKSSSLSFTVTLDAQARGSSKVTMNLLAYDGYGNSLGNDALNADVLPVKIVPDENVAGVIGDVVPSNQGPEGEKHFVSPKKSAAIPDDYVILKAEGPTEQLFQNFLVWEGGEAVPNEPLKRRVKRDVAVKTVVKVKNASNGQEVDKLNVWVVWASVSIVNLPSAVFYLTSNVDLADGTIGNRVNFIASTNNLDKITFEFDIQPIELFDETADIPDLKGAPNIPPPGGIAPLNTLETLSTGASQKWDDTRAIKISLQNPNIPAGKFPQNSLLIDNPSVLTGQPKNGVIVAFPSDDAVGNDDTFGTGLGGDPYSVSEPGTPNWLKHGKGKMRSDDRPSSSISDYLAEGLSYEELDEFREFIRLNIGAKWYRVSDYKYWEFRLRTVKQNGVMINNGSFSGIGL